MTPCSVIEGTSVLEEHVAPIVSAAQLRGIMSLKT